MTDNCYYPTLTFGRPSEIDKIGLCGYDWESNRFNKQITLKTAEKFGWNITFHMLITDILQGKC